MKVYLAAPWVEREKARGVQDALIVAGFEVTSRWLYVDETTCTQRDEAYHDLDDLDAADVLVVLNGPISEGKAFEQGYAHCAGKSIIAVGSAPSNVFQHMDEIQVVPTIADAINRLRLLTPRNR